MHKRREVELKNLAFHFFRDELAYEPYMKQMEEIFKNWEKEDEVKDD